jgi:hypothetical protein
MNGPLTAPAGMDSTGFPENTIPGVTDKKLRALQYQQQQILIQQQQQQLLAARQQLLLQQQMQNFNQPLSRGRSAANEGKNQQDMAMSIRSPLLEEFRNSKNKKYELSVSC